jgi:16S rRNA (guanine527-N7)-methyltransferase
VDDREIFDATLADAARAMNLGLNEPQRACMWRHFTLMVEANRHFNLTRITTPSDAAIKHYADSLTLLATDWVDRERALTVLDVGTGAGFPAVPLAIVCPKWRVTAIDGTGKKARFVADAAGRLGLANLTAIHARAADLARQEGGAFDLVVMRAVTQLAPGIEEVHRLVKTAGAVVFYKSGTCSEQELRTAATRARLRGLSVVTTHTLQLPVADGPLERRLIRYARSA